MTREEFLCEFRRIVNRYTKFVISGHIKPDGDSVGACVALALFLKGLDKTVCVVYDGASERYAEVAALAPSFEPGEGYEVARGEFVFIMLIAVSRSEREAPRDFLIRRLQASA